MIRRMLASAAALSVLAGCSTSTPEPPPSPTPTVAAGNGSLYVADQGEGTIQIIRYPLDAEGNLGPAIDITSGETDFTGGPYVIDGIGNSVAVGQFEDYWTKNIELLDATDGKQRSSIAAPRWCGGEGLTYNPCTMASSDLLVRTSERGDPDELEATVWVSSLTDGSDTGTWGPFRNLGNMYGTTDPSVVLMTVSDVDPSDPPEITAGSVQSLDPATGKTAELGAHEAGWLPICPLGTDAMLGWNPNSSAPSASVVGDATIGPVAFPDSQRPLGCSADGRFLYLEGGGGEEPAVITRVTLADGSSTEVLTLEQGASATAVTR